MRLLQFKCTCYNQPLACSLCALQFGASLFALQHWVQWVAAFLPTFEIGDRVQLADGNFPGAWCPDVYTVTEVYARGDRHCYRVRRRKRYQGESDRCALADGMRLAPGETAP